MIGLLTMVFSTLGATGMGSLLKMLGGLVDRWAAASETRAKGELLREVERAKLDAQWQEVVFGNNEGGKYARTTRRIIAVIGMLNFATISILCTIWPSVPMVTFTPPEQRESFTLLWGLVDFPSGTDTTVAVTTGHLAITSLVTLGAIVGFYFTPGGRGK